MKIPVRRKPEAPAPVEPRYVWRIGDHERCDRCRIARAYVCVRLSSGAELLFCAHHFRQHEVALRLIAAEIIDERERLLLRPVPSRAEYP